MEINASTTQSVLTPPFGHDLFAETFAAYLRHHPSRWRLRRTDVFVPQDVNIAAREVFLDARIDRALIRDFFKTAASDRLKRVGDITNSFSTITCFVPTFTHPKRLLLSSQQSINGSPLPSLQRYDDARILARDLLGILLEGERPSGTPPLRDDQDMLRLLAPDLLLITATLVFNDPFRLWDRLKTWVVEKRLSDCFFVDGGLAVSDSLKRWIAKESGEFMRGLPTPLLRELDETIESYCSSDRGEAFQESFYISRSDRPGALAVFPTIESLLLHGIQDLLKLIVETASPESGEHAMPSRRDELVNHPNDVVNEVKRIFAIVPRFSQLLRNQRRGYAYHDFVRHLDRWVSYATVTFIPNVPFTIGFTDTDVFRTPEGVTVSKRSKLIKAFSAKQFYTLPIRDALSVHIEIRSAEPELAIGRRRVVSWSANQQKFKPRLVTEVFGHKFEPSNHLIHRYSSKRPYESESLLRDYPSRRLFLETRIRLARSVLVAYFLACCAFAAVATFVAYVAWRGVLDRSTSPLMSDALTVGALATGLALWLITTQYRVRIVHHRLFTARLVMQLSIAITVISLAAYGIRDLWSGLQPDHGRNTCTGLLLRTKAATALIHPFQKHGLKAATPGASRLPLEIPGLRGRRSCGPR